MIEPGDESEDGLPLPGELPFVFGDDVVLGGVAVVKVARDVLHRKAVQKELLDGIISCSME